VSHAGREALLPVPRSLPQTQWHPPATKCSGQGIAAGQVYEAALFGPDRNKEFFYVFDYCGNFEFFNENPEGVEGNLPESLGTKLFRHRLDLLQAIRAVHNHEVTAVVREGDSGLREIENGLVDMLYGEVASMNLENFIVRTQRREVKRFQNRDAWKELTDGDYADLLTKVAGLPNQLEPEHPTARFFDLLMLKIQLGTLRPDPATPNLIVKVREIVTELAQLERIPAVKNEIVLIQEIQGAEYWKDITLPMLEQIRRRIRDLVKFIPPKSRKIVVTDFEDELGASVEIDVPNLSAAIDRAQYKKKFLEFLKTHEDHLALKKLKYNEPLTSLDLAELDRLLFESGEVGSREDFENCYGEQEHLSRFIRQLVGLDREAAQRVFDSYLDTTSFSSNQIRFIKQIIDYLTQNGVMDPNMLFEHPFTNLSPTGPTGLFRDEDAAKIVRIIRTINTNAEAASA
jgi:type I restriction enzyme R subunit